MNHLTQFPKISAHTRAVLQALLVTFLWSTSWVLIKFGLAGIPPLTFAGLRYSLAVIVLLAWAAPRGSLGRLARLPARRWAELAALGVVYYTLTQGAQFVALAYLPAISVNLVLNFTPVLVALLGIGLLAERPGPPQWIGLALTVTGVLVYFYPANIPAAQVTGLVAAGVGLLANAGSAVMGRANNRRADLSPLEVTVASMGVGSLLLLGAGLAFQGLPPLTWQHILVIAWLAVVNTALAFTLWNLSLRTLSAVEASILNGTMLVQIAVLAVIFLDERLTGKGLLGLALVGVGAWLVQRK